MKRNKKNYCIYILMLLIFGVLIYEALLTGEKFTGQTDTETVADSGDNAFNMFKNIIIGNLQGPLTVLLFQIIIILFSVRIFSYLFKYIGQPGVIGEIIAGIVLGPSVLGLFFPDFFHALFPADSLTNLELLSQIGLILFMFVIGMDVDFNLLKNKMNETLVISHAGIIVPFFLGIAASFWIYEEYAAHQTEFLPFALFIGISMSITAFPVLARIIQERNMTKTPIGVLAIASAANDNVTAWCLLAIVIAVAKAGTFLSALYTVGITILFIAFMFGIVRPFLRKVGDSYINAEVINKTFVAFIFLILIASAVTTEIIGIHALFGAFLTGVVMPTNPGFRKVMMEKVEDIALIFFLPLFFAFTGLRTEIGLINTLELWMVCILLIFIAILGKLGGCTIAARLVGETWKDSLTVGTLMNTRGLMELVALNIGYEMGVLSPEIFVILILMALITTFMTTPILKTVEKIFQTTSEVTTNKFKLLLSFGRPESGKLLLSVAAHLFGKQLEDTEIIAAHYTIGTDVNPRKAKQYAEESFVPLEQEASRLNLNVDKRYKVTDHLIREISQLTNKEKAHLLLIGAGPQFLQPETSPPAQNQACTLSQRTLKNIRQRFFQLPGGLMKDKLQEVIKNTDSPVAIFVNRGYTRIRRLFMLLLDEKDFSLLPYIQKLFAENETVIHLCFLTPVPPSPHLEESMEKTVKATRLFTRDQALVNNRQINQPDSLLIVSYSSCIELTRDPSLFTSLPSLLVMNLPE